MEASYAGMHTINPESQQSKSFGQSAVIGTRGNMRVIDRKQNVQGTIQIEVLQYDALLGSTNKNTAQALWFMAQSNIKARQVAIYIKNDGVKIEPGAMSYFQGPLEMVSGVTAGNMIGRMISGALTGEKMAMPEYRGSGILVLEPSFKHYILAELEPNETIITDKGMFYCVQSSVNVQPVMNNQLSGALLGGEGIFQTALTGPGIIVLESPVPLCEINIIHLNNDVLRVDGNFALLRSGNIGFTVERSARTLLDSAVSGEGLVNVFRGTGDVWIAPTLKVYDAVQHSDLYDGELSAIDMNTSSGKTKAK